jgi:hypothetical protein
MEYGICVSDIRTLPADPRLVCADQWRELLPPGPLRAVYFGSEFCEELLPAQSEAESFCALAAAAGVEAVLLTPLVTPHGLGRVDRLLRGLVSSGWLPAVVGNDWGVLALLRDSYPPLQRRGGRLLNRGLRDPRLPERTPARESGRADRGERLRQLLCQLGVAAVETDADLEGGFLGEKRAGLQRVLHLPYAFAASGRNCLVKADGRAPGDSFTRGLGLPCQGECRGRWHRLERSDSPLPLWRQGNTVFYEVPPYRAEVHLTQADRVVLHEGPRS